MSKVYTRICIVTIIGAKIVVYLEKENIFINCFYFISTNKINMKESCILDFMIIANVLSNITFPFSSTCFKIHFVRLTFSHSAVI